MLTKIQYDNPCPGIAIATLIAQQLNKVRDEEDFCDAIKHFCH